MGAEGAPAAASGALGMCASVSGGHWFCEVGVSIPRSPATEAGSGPQLAGGEGKF